MLKSFFRVLKIPFPSLDRRRSVKIFLEYLALAARSRRKVNKIVGRYRDLVNGATVHLVCGGPSLSLSEIAMSPGDLLITCNRVFRVLEGSALAPDIHIFADRNISNNITEMLLSETLKSTFIFKPIAFRSEFDNEKRIVNYNSVLEYSAFGSDHFPSYSIPEKSDRCPAGRVVFSDCPEVVIQSYFTIAYGMMQLAASLRPKCIIIYGCDLSYDLVGSGSYAKDYVKDGDRMDKEGWLETKNMLRSMEHARDCCLASGISVLNGSSRSPLKIFPRVVDGGGISNGSHNIRA